MRQVSRQHVRLIGRVDAVDVGVQVTAGVQPALQLLGDERLEEALEEGVLVSVAVGHAGSLSDSGDRLPMCVKTDHPGPVQFSVRPLRRVIVMKTMSYTDSRARYAEVLDAVVDDREEIVITRSGHDPVVIVALDDFESLRETAYLMRSPANARRLLDAMERLEAGGGEEHEMVDAD
jgi:antitoxin YefM